MKKEFKTPVIEICNINIDDSIMASGERILETGGIKSTVKVFTLQQTEYTPPSTWQDWL